jgi:hypothetical protein
LAIADGRSGCIHLVSLDTGAYVCRLSDQEVALSRIDAVAATADGLLWAAGVTRAAYACERAQLFCITEAGQVLVRVSMAMLSRPTALLVKPCGDLLMLTEEGVLQWRVPPGQPMKAPLRQRMVFSARLQGAVAMALMSQTVLAIADSVAEDGHPSCVRICSLQEDTVTLLRTIDLEDVPIGLAVTPDGLLVVLGVDTRYPGDLYAARGARSVSFWTLAGERVLTLAPPHDHAFFNAALDVMRFRAVAVAADGRLLLTHYGGYHGRSTDHLPAVGVVVF